MVFTVYPVRKNVSEEVVDTGRLFNILLNGCQLLKQQGKVKRGERQKAQRQRETAECGMKFVTRNKECQVNSNDLS
jgi:hypothetical protein